jgi:predicted transcriptional regulator of viral defense system
MNRAFDYPPLRIARFSEIRLTEGVEEHEIDRVPVRITGIARTVADCFNCRNKIGLDVALNALKEALKAQGSRGGRGCRASA